MKLSVLLKQNFEGRQVLKILFVTNMYPNAENPDSGVFVMDQAERLRRFGHHVDILHIKGYHSKLNYLKAAFDVFIRTWNGRYDIVHAHYGLSGFPALFRWRTSLVITLHGSDALVGKIQPLISRCVCLFAGAVIVVSKKIASIIPGQVIPCGIDLEVFKSYNRNEARDRLGLPVNKRLILFPFDPKRKIKRYDLANAVINRLALKGHNISLLVVSGKRNDEMPWYYSAADAMILCSDSEGSPVSIKEALACNTPVVSVNVGDVEEIMDGIKGANICESNVDSLSEGLDQILAQEDPHDFDGHSAMQRYDHSRVIESIVVGVYQRVLHRRNRRQNL